MSNLVYVRLRLKKETVKTQMVLTGLTLRLGGWVRGYPGESSALRQ